MVDIILVLYGDRDDLDKCVASIEEHCVDYKLHIIDNNEENRGFTKAMNMGIQLGKAPYIWLLNQDAVVLPGAMEGLIKRLDADDKIGIAGSMQLDPEDNDLIRHGGTIQAFPNGIHDGGRLSMGHCLIPKKQTWVNYASVMFKRKMVEEIGLLDENMFLLYSDSDYCYWARYRGWEVWYEPTSRVIHRLGKASKNSAEIGRRDMSAFMDKWNISPVTEGRFTSGRLFERLNRHP
mgnify:CR=1 FL=1